MSDRFPGLVEIGGPIPRWLVPPLLARVQAAGLRWNWCEDEVAANTPEELLEELRQHDSPVLSVGDDEALGGMFESLEEFLVEQGIAFDRRSDAKYEYDGEIVFFRLGMKRPGWCLATQDGEPTIRLDDLQPIRGLFQAGNHGAALTELDALLDRIPPLPPLTIVEGAFRHSIIVRRDSRDEETFAVICWNGVEPDALLDALRRALRQWQQTPEGQAAWEESAHDFNIGDLSSAPCGFDPLRSILQRHGIQDLDIDVHSCSTYIPRYWSYDIRLMDPIEGAEITSQQVT